MSEAGFCNCDADAYVRGDPFCGYCGRRVGSPWLHDASGDLLLNLPHRMNSKPPAGAPFLALEIKPHAASPGIVDSSRFLDASGELQLTQLTLTCDGRAFELEPTVSKSAFQFSLPREFEGSGLPGLATLRCAFTLRTSAPHRPYIFTLHLQPENLYVLSSDDARFEDQAAFSVTGDPYAVWLFDDSHEPLTLTLATEFRANASHAPNFNSVSVSNRTGNRRRLAGEVVSSAADALTLTLKPSALRDVLAPASEGRVCLYVQDDRAANAAVFDLQVHAQRAPRLLLEPPVIFQIDFKAHKKGWLTKGCDDLKNILNYDDDVRLWKPQFELSVVASVELDEAAHFSAHIDAGYLTINARLKPEWLNAANRPPLEGSAKLLLRNANNSRQSAQQPLGGLLRMLAEIKIVIDWDKRGSVPVLAIDFGTTNTCAAVIPSYNDVTSREIEIFGESDSNVPTLLFYTLRKTGAGREEVASVVFGKRALSEGRRVISSTCFKKGIKTELLSPKQRLIPVGENLSLSARELTTDYLTPFLKAAMLSPDIDGRPIEKLVFTFPVAAPPRYTEMLGEAIAAAVARLRLPIKKDDIVKSCDEASAGGIWWFCKKKSETQLPEKVSLLVFDYGGGTTDLSVLEFQKVNARWQVTIKGISGLSPCGGEDLTWRMAREFVACATREKSGTDPLRPISTDAPLEPIRPDSMLGKNLAQTAELYGREEWQKKPYTRFLLEIIEERKIAAVGGEQIDALPQAVFLDLLENAESAFVPSSVDFRGDAIGLSDSCALNGTVAMCKFNEYKQQSAEFVAAASPAEGMLPGHSWLFNVQDKLLEEPVRAIEIAGNLIEHLYGGGKVDYLLLIGQASKTRAVQAMIRARLGAQFGEIATEGMQKPKSCVALGACDFHLQRDDWDFRPTLLHRVIYLDGLTFKQLLRSDAERNAVVILQDAELLRRPGSKLAVLADCSYAHRGEEGLRQEMEQLGANGFDRVEPGKTVKVLVASPHDADTYAKLDARIRVIVDAHDHGSAIDYWYFLAWVEDELNRAWIFRYHI